MKTTADILLVDDDPTLCELLTALFADEGMSTVVCHDGESGLRRARDGVARMVVLDVMLPRMSGFEVLRALRQSSDVPVLMLTARGEAVDRIVGLEIGADKYLPKPFNPRELVARVRAIARRAARSGGGGRALAVGEVRLDPGTRSVVVAEVALELTTSEFDLLEVLLGRAGEVVSRDTLCREALGRRHNPLDRSVDVHVSSVRRKLRSVGVENSIKTVRGEGYLYARERTP